MPVLLLISSFFFFFFFFNDTATTEIYTLSLHDALPILSLPSRYFAARSGRAGVRRGSSIAFAQQFIDRARGLAFAALGPRWFGGRRPAVDIDMQPALGGIDETLQEQRAGDRAGECA